MKGPTSDTLVTPPHTKDVVELVEQHIARHDTDFGQSVHAMHRRFCQQSQAEHTIEKDDDHMERQEVGCNRVLAREPGQKVHQLKPEEITLPRTEPYGSDSGSQLRLRLRGGGGGGGGGTCGPQRRHRATGDS